MTKYFRDKNIYSQTSDKALDIHDRLPNGVYTIGVSITGYFFEQIEGFGDLGKIYGNAIERCERIFTTFMNRPASTGVLLTGEKGSGKTMLAKLLSQRCGLDDIPTIIINQKLMGESFLKLIANITQPAMILFDEFEKIYDQDEQQSLLTLLDGVFSTKKLFVLTCNDKWKVNNHMHNRPGRLFYMLDYKGLDEDFIREFCNDNLNDKEMTESVVALAAMFPQFSFDMLKALVEEMNRYNEAPKEALEMLNISPIGGGVIYDIEVFYKGQRVNPERVDPEEWNGAPILTEVINFEIYDTDADEEEIPQKDGSKQKMPSILVDGSRFKITSEDMIKMDNGRFEYKTGDYKIIFKKPKTKAFDYRIFM